MTLRSSDSGDQTSLAGGAPVVAEPASAEQRWVTWMTPTNLTDHLFGVDCRALRAAAPSSTGKVLSDITSPSARAAWNEATVLITGWGIPPLTEADLDAAPHLRHILHAGGQASSVVPASAWDRGIRVANAGLANAVPVAEYTVAMVVLANKSAFLAERLYHDRQGWIDREENFSDSGNTRRVVGVVGASRIGRMVIDRLGSFDLSVLVYDPFVSADEIRRLGARSVELDELLASSDVVSLHPPLNRSTTGMIGRRELTLMRDGSTLINTSRGAVVDQDALVSELLAGRIRAILDVTEPDVLPRGHVLYDLENAFITPHIAGSMGHELARIGRQVASELERISTGLDPLHLEPRP